MRVIGVVDLLGGRAVHARRGDRDRYTAVQVSGGATIEGDAVALARVYLDRVGLRDLYVADLDAILHARPQRAPVSAIAALGMPVWLDAGVSSVESVRCTLDLGVARAIVGLETLSSFVELAAICDAVGSDRVAFSLDVRDGVPLSGGDIPADATPEALAAHAVNAGARAVILIDLARVGSGLGVDRDLLARVRRAVPDVTLVAGGGVRTIADIDRLADSRCDGVLVATALHDGSLSPADLAPYL